MTTTDTQNRLDTTLHAAIDAETEAERAYMEASWLAHLSATDAEEALLGSDNDRYRLAARARADERRADNAYATWLAANQWTSECEDRCL